MRRLRVAALAAVLTAAAAAPAASAPERLTFIGSDAFPPYQYLDQDGQPRGFNVELMRALARETGIEIRVRLVTTPMMQALIASGEADLVSLAYNERRAERFTWLLPLWRLRQVALFVTPPARPPRSLRDLRGERVAVPRGSMLWEELQAIPAGEGPEVVPIANDYTAAIEALDNGRATVLVGNALSLEHLGVLGRFGGRHQATLGSAPYYLAAAPGREDLQPVFFEAFTRLQESGAFSQIVEETLLQRPANARVGLWGASLLGVFALGAVGFGLWNRTLRSQVELNTRELQAVAERLAFHGLVQAQVSDAIIVINGDRRVTMWNAGAETIFGIPAGEVLGTRADGLIVGMVVDTDLPALRRQVEREGIWRGESRIKRADGIDLYVEAVVQVLRRPDGHHDGHLVVVHDIDARKRAEDELRSALALHLATLESIAEGIVSVDVDGRMTSYNERFRDLWGIPPELLAAGDFIRIAEWAGEHVVADASAMAGFRRALAATGVDTSVLRFKDGRIIERYSLPQRLDGRIVGRVWSYRDVTERARADEDRRKLEGQIQQMQKLESLGVLAGGIAHDFNNLLVGMLGHAGLALMDAPPDSPVRERIQQIETCALRAAELTNQMLAYSGKGRFVVEPADLTGVVREMSNLLQTAISKDARLELQLAGGLPAVLADTAQLRQVVMNLITNASDAIGARGGTIVVTTGTVEATRGYLDQAYMASGAEPGHYVYLEVRDSGCGMDADTQARIFEPFFTTKFTGRGLGLAAVLGIIRGHRGAVHLDSAPGKGTTFRVLFPASGAPAAAAAAAPGRVRASKQARVLVVDDEPAVRMIARETLTRAGFTVVPCADGAEAIERVRAEGPAIDAVLLDMTMPGLNGIDTLRAIHEIVRDLPVVLTSGYSEQEAADRCGAEVMAGFIQKPFAPSALVAKINDVLAAGVRG